jgi:hypothetical protein
MFVVFMDRKNPEYSKASIDMYRYLQEVSKIYKQFAFTYSEEERYRSKKKEMGITWDEEPSISLNSGTSEEFIVFPRSKPITLRNLRKFIEGCRDGTINSKKFKYPDSLKNFVHHLKKVTKIKKTNFDKVVLEEGKDVALLLFDSTDQKVSTEK